jgi:hypothetical protein
MANRSRVMLALVSAGLLVGCGTSHRATLRISGEGGIGPVLSRADVRAAQAGFHQPGDPVVLLKLTPNGQRKLLALVTRVAKAGRRRHRSLHLLISVNGKVISQPEVVVYNPNGLPVPGPPKGINVDVASIRVAHDLAATLNR